MQYETIIDEKVISSGERVFCSTYLKKLIIGTNCYTQTDSNNIVIPLRMIVHPKLKRFLPNCINGFPGSLCIKSLCGSLFYKGLIQISQFLHDGILY